MSVLAAKQQKAGILSAKKATIIDWLVDWLNNWSWLIFRTAQPTATKTRKGTVANKGDPKQAVLWGSQREKGIPRTQA